MGTELRDYQLDALSHLHRRIHDEWRRLYVDLPTGTGKSTIAAAFAAQRLQETHGRVLALVHRQDLVRQLAQTFQREGLAVEC
jgi:superfamily II DNA or RNA helicase